MSPLSWWCTRSSLPIHGANEAGTFLHRNLVSKRARRINDRAANPTRYQGSPPDHYCGPWSTGNKAMVSNENLHPEYNSMTGSWVLDLSRSDTFEAYLRCLGTPQPAIQAQVAGERAYQSRNVIAIDRFSLIIHKDTAVHHFTEAFELGQERRTPRRTISGSVGRGGNVAMASLADEGHLDGYVVATATTGPSGRPSQETVEVRQLIDRGLAHAQQINVRNLATGEECVVTRTWVRVPMTPEDQIRLLAE